MASASHAAAGTFDVKGVEVTSGETVLALDGAWQNGFPVNSDFLRQSYKLEATYSFTSWFKAGVELNLQQHVGDNLEANSAGVEAQLVLLQPSDRPVGLAWFMRYDPGIENGESDILTFGPLVSFTLARRLEVTLNPLFEKEWNPTKPSLTFSYAWQVKTEIADNISLGAEGYGSIPDIGNPPGIDFQEHRVGPVLYISLGGNGRAGSSETMKLGIAGKSRPEPKIELQLGVLFGLTEATADTAGKAKLAVSF